MENYYIDKLHQEHNPSIEILRPAKWFKHVSLYILGISTIIISATLFHEEALANSSKPADSLEANIDVSSNPFEELSQAYNRLFRDGTAIWQANDFIFSNSFSTFSSHLKADDKQYTYSIAIPGYDKEEIQIELQSEYLIIKAQRLKNTNEAEDSTTLNKKETNIFYQKISLPRDIDKNIVSSNLKNGLLTITFQRAPRPKKEDVKIIPIN